MPERVLGADAGSRRQTSGPSGARATDGPPYA